jgi:hypothetical protein
LKNDAGERPRRFLCLKDIRFMPCHT